MCPQQGMFVGFSLLDGAKRPRCLSQTQTRALPRPLVLTLRALSSEGVSSSRTQWPFLPSHRLRPGLPINQTPGGGGYLERVS